MQDYTIGESYTLPSLGKVYPFEVNPNFKIRSMTTEEEMKRVASVDYPYKNMSEIIDDCILEGIGVSSYDLCIGDYQYLLHKLRVVTYGPEYSMLTKCVYCGCEHQEEINLEELPTLEYNEEYEKYKEFDLPKTGKHIVLRVQTPKILDAISNRTKDYKRKIKGDSTSDPTIIYVMAELIETVDGKVPDPGRIEEWLRKLPMADTNKIVQYADKMNQSIGVNTKLICDCPICGLSYRMTMATTSEFFRPALD